MTTKWRDFLKEEDTRFLVSVLSLAALGLVMVYSSSYVYAHETFQDGYHFFKRHIVFLALGMGGLWVVSKIPLNFWIEKSKWITGGLVLLTLLVWIPGMGVKIGGATRWLQLGPFRAQPVEFLKVWFPLGYAIFLTSWIESHSQSFRSNFKEGFLPTLIFPAVVSIPVLIQPDYGSFVLIWAVAFLLLYSFKANFLYLFSLFLTGVVALGSLVLAAPYRMRRVAAFLDPWKDPLDSGFQTLQSFAAITSGGFFGKGLGNSQAKLFFLPSAQNDFIFSILGEEFGFIGILGFLFLLGYFLKGCLNIALRYQNSIAGHFTFGFMVLIAGQSMINMGVSLGLLPNKGLTLPFISYGGSSLVAILFACGVLYRFTKESIDPVYQVTECAEPTRLTRRGKKVSAGSPLVNSSKQIFQGLISVPVIIFSGFWVLVTKIISLVTGGFSSGASSIGSMGRGFGSKLQTSHKRSRKTIPSKRPKLVSSQRVGSRKRSVSNKSSLFNRSNRRRR